MKRILGLIVGILLLLMIAPTVSRAPDRNAASVPTGISQSLEELVPLMDTLSTKLIEVSSKMQQW